MKHTKAPWKLYLAITLNNPILEIQDKNGKLTCRGFEYEVGQVIDHEGEELPDYLSDVEMYCGCHVCETREHLMATFNWLRVNNIVDIAVV
jgi:hypothetical protein